MYFEKGKEYRIDYFISSKTGIPVRVTPSRAELPDIVGVHVFTDPSCSGLYVYRGLV